jgi:hypothetical protein
LQDPPKFTQIGTVGLKIYHLETLIPDLRFFSFPSESIFIGKNRLKRDKKLRSRQTKFGRLFSITSEYGGGSSSNCAWNWSRFYKTVSAKIYR